MLHVLLEDELGVLIDELLHGTLYEFVERVDLLRDERVGAEVGRNHHPAVALAM